MITINYFASFRESMNKGQDQIKLPASVSTVSDLIVHLSDADSAFSALLDTAPKMLVAVNHTVVPQDHKLSANDEVAFFPPMTGG